MENLTSQEAGLFDDAAASPAASEPDPFAAAPAGEEDEEAKLTRQLAEAKAKKEAAKKAAEKAAAEAAAKKAAEAKTAKCEHCSEQLTPENASQLQDGKWKHIGCKKAPGAAPEPQKPAETKRGKSTPAASGELVVTLKLDDESLAKLAALLKK